MQRGQKRKKKASPAPSDVLADSAPTQVAQPRRTKASHEDAWSVVYLYRAADGTMPARDFLDACPVKVRAEIRAVLDAVAKAPPPKFSGGGKWEAMHGMGGIYEVRVRHSQTLYRLFCVLDHTPAGDDLLVLIDGAEKPNRGKLTDADYAHVRRLRDEYKASDTRSYR